ncbi:COMM domain-containing protein 1-like [Acipenser ruthenus]|uniref:COMM domain-containing protein 1-like n=1 Tax=Acipenser ruthenus TaxID=7906 RepID=UPI0027424D78|nr:COMM domain-containing protein 1-like [Acipenser ruthenus]
MARFSVFSLISSTWHDCMGLLAVCGLVFQSIASADMDFNQLEAFLTAQTKKQGGVSAEQAAVLSKFWKNHKSKIRESLISQSRWDNSLRNVSWRVDLKTQSRHADQVSAAVGVVELELGKTGKAR